MSSMARIFYNCERSELSGEFNGTDFLYYCERSEFFGLFNGTDFLYNWASGSEPTLVCSICRFFAIFIYIITVEPHN